MWRRKTLGETLQDERATLRRRNMLGLPVCWAVCISLFLSATYALGFRGRFRPMSEAMSLRDALRQLPFHAVSLFPFAFGILVYTRRKGMWEGSGDARICVSCHHVQRSDTERCIRCSEVTEALSTWRWSK